MSKTNDTLREKAISSWGRVNILVTGKTGVGKSTLINSILTKVFSLPPQAETGVGRPVTKHICAHRDPNGEIPICFFDTPGLELEQYQETMTKIKSLVETRKDSKQVDQHIHCAWLCISEGSSRVEEAEQHLCRFLAETVPVIVVITKSRANTGEFEICVRNELPSATGFTRVRAMEEIFHTPTGEFVLPCMGFDSLVEMTTIVIPKGKAMASNLAVINSNRSKLRWMIINIKRWFLGRT